LSAVRSLLPNPEQRLVPEIVEQKSNENRQHTRRSEYVPTAANLHGSETFTTEELLQRMWNYCR
jgi:hypothetical protein